MSKTHWSDDTPHCAECGVPLDDFAPYRDVPGGREYYCEFHSAPYECESVEAICAVLEGTDFAPPRTHFLGGDE